MTIKTLFVKLKLNFKQHEKKENLSCALRFMNFVYHQLCVHELIDYENVSFDCNLVFFAGGILTINNFKAWLLTLALICFQS